MAQIFTQNDSTITCNGATIIGRNNTINGRGNTINGNHNIINGDHNKINGDDNTIIGDSNSARGANNVAFGNFNDDWMGGANVTGAKRTYASVTEVQAAPTAASLPIPIPAPNVVQVVASSSSHATRTVPDPAAPRPTHKLTKFPRELPCPRGYMAIYCVICNEGLRNISAWPCGCNVLCTSCCARTRDFDAFRNRKSHCVACRKPVDEFMIKT